MNVKLGRLPRGYNPRIPHLAALRSRIALPAAPTSIDYTVGLPSNLGMMGNDQVGDCGEAGYFHAVQVWTQNATQAVMTASTNVVEQLYSDGAGYVPDEPSTDNGTNLQSLLTYLMNTGAMMPSGTRHKILGFVEVDPLNVNDLNLAMAECGVLYLGFTVPQYLMDGLTRAGSVWDVDPAANQTLVGGHCVCSAKYGADGTRGMISWGSADYSMTPAFWHAHVDEVYAIIDPLFIEITGKTPFGLTQADWAEQMQALKVA